MIARLGSLVGLLLLLSFQLRAARVDTTAFYSDAMHKRIPCVVVVPDASKDTALRYPVIYLLHGYSGNHLSWISISPELVRIADDEQVMFVCPDGGYRSWYMDSPVDTTMRYETAIGSELIHWVDNHYPSLSDRRFRAITGLSMGGHGGLFLGIRHPDLFCAAGSTSGGVDIRPFPKNWDLQRVLGDPLRHAQHWEDHTVIRQIEQLKSGELELIVDCGTEDFFLDVNRALHRRLEERQIRHTYIETPGKHNGAYWSKSILPQISFFLQLFQSARSMDEKK